MYLKKLDKLSECYCLLCHYDCIFFSVTFLIVILYMKYIKNVQKKNTLKLSDTLKTPSG